MYVRSTYLLSCFLDSSWSLTMTRREQQSRQLHTSRLTASMFRGRRVSLISGAGEIILLIVAEGNEIGDGAMVALVALAIPGTRRKLGRRRDSTATATRHPWCHVSTRVDIGIESQTKKQQQQ